MRRVTRRKDLRPSILGSSVAIAYRADLTRYLESDTVEMRPPQPPSLLLEAEEVRKALLQQFDGACAYCETPISFERANVDHFRPFEGADRGEGRIDFRHYCWLALEWDNLYLACDACQRAKRNFFPIRGKSRASAPLAELVRSEQPLLLDPCRDHPPQHLALEGGFLVGTSDAGRTTIEILQLNRPELAGARAQTLERLRSLLRDSWVMPPLWVTERVSDMFDDGPFRGLLYIALLQDLPSGSPLVAWRATPPSTGRAARLAEVTHPRLSGGGVPAKPHQLLDTSDRRYVRQVTIENFKGVQRAVVDFPHRGRAGSKSPGSLVILGENAAGKTSILQATALGAMGPGCALEAGVAPGECLRDDAQYGRVEVRFWDTEETNVVEFMRGSDTFGGHRQVETTVLGYGAYRLPARRQLGPAKRSGFRVGSLFSERELVNGPFGLELQFQGAMRQQRVEDATRALNALLVGSTRARLSRKGILIEEAGRTQRLANLSSGFKSVVTIATDVMDVMYEVWGGISSAQALVVIDEIDAHLHPAWRLRIVDALRTTFPLSQFMLSTHDPLVLRGLERQEIYLLERAAGGALHLSKPRASDTRGLTVDQILTSDLFGLESTLDPDTTRNLNEYYRLLAIPDPHPDEVKRREELARRLPLTRPIGTTRRERLLYAVIEKYLKRTFTLRHADVWDPQVVDELIGEFEDAQREMDTDDPA